MDRYMDLALPSRSLASKGDGVALRARASFETDRFAILLRTTLRT